MNEDRARAETHQIYHSILRENEHFEVLNELLSSFTYAPLYSAKQSNSFFAALALMTSGMRGTCNNYQCPVLCKLLLAPAEDRRALSS